ncbi:MAG: hypothetical protein JO091_02185 [Acidobacteriaceae bacterium]|nr:hypothetical protein [Acidobacteriaceae bacterium]
MRLLQKLAERMIAALGFCARCLVRLVPANAHARAAAEKLRAEFRAMAPLGIDSESDATNAWLRYRTRLRECVLAEDPRAFLTWGVIRESMSSPPYARYVRSELSVLRSHDWDRWRGVIRERLAGLPFPFLFYPASSATAIHHTYHLCRLEIETGARVRDFGTIVEFGGGYGSMQRIAYNAGFRGTYIVCDLPEFAALQRYYLAMVGVGEPVIVTDLKALRGAIGHAAARPRLFLATWSLSEAPLEVRREVIDLVRDFDAFLIAYQDQFHEIDNRSFFSGWKSVAIEQLPGHYYSFGPQDKPGSR